MPTGRTRAYVDASYVGSRTHLPTGHIDYATIPGQIHKCVDVVGNYPNCNPFYVDHYGGMELPGLLTGRKLSGAVYSFAGFPMDNQGVYPSWHYTVPGIPSNVAALTDMQAKTNPSRAEVSLPNFLFELRDFPEMLHLRGQEHKRRMSSNSIAENNFGWSLLFQDLGKLIDFNSQVNSRVKELTNLHKKGGLRRSRTIFNGSASTTSGFQTFHSNEAFVDGWVDITTTTRIWASCKWQPDSPQIPSADELLQQARLAVHGWDFSSSGLASVVWEAIPWSWLADYMGNVGSFFAANKNSVGAGAIDGCVMNHTKTKGAMRFNSVSQGFHATPSSYVIDSKYRELETSGLSVNMPFLSNRQMVTLLGIAANFR
jgi:hypothetical protein